MPILNKQPNYSIILIVFFGVFISLIAVPLFAQSTPPPMRLSLREFYDLIEQNHPVVGQARLLNEAARQQLRMARGAFDPKLELDFNQKTFNDKTYYNALDTYLKVPVWFGTDIQAGVERNVGSRINPESLTPQNGLFYAGLQIPLGRGMFVDERRIVLRQAQLFRNIAAADQAKEINKVLLSAAKDYWEWYFSYQQFLQAQVGYDLARVRFRAVRSRIIVGELARIDSVEAKIILQDRLVLLTQSRLDLQNSRLTLSNYLWSKDFVPLELDTLVVPQSITSELVSAAQLENMRQQALQNHPEIIKNRFKARQLEYDLKLGREMLKPTLNLKLMYLSAAPDLGREWSSKYLSSNYKFGVDFSMPLFLRKERGKIGLVETKVEQTRLEGSLLARQIDNQIQSAYNQLINLTIQLDLQTQMRDNYRLLLAGELTKFELGESSLFLVNTRESKLIEATIKLASLQSKYQKSKAELAWAAGTSEWAEMVQAGK